MAIKVLLEVMPPILFSDLVVSASESFSQSKPEFAEVYAFFIERLVYFLGRKFRYDTIRAVVADRDHEREAFSVPREALRRVEVLERFRDTGEGLWSPWRKKLRQASEEHPGEVGERGDLAADLLRRAFSK